MIKMNSDKSGTAGKTNVRNPKQKRSIETKNKILDAAFDLFSEKGFHGTNSNEIAKKAGVAIGTFYAYFPDKKPVFIEVLRQYSASIKNKATENMQKIINKDMNERVMISNYIKAMLNAHELSPAFHREVNAMRFTDFDVQEFFMEDEKDTIEKTALFLSHFKNSLRVKDLNTAAFIMNSAVEEVVYAVKIFSSGIDKKKLIEETTDMLYRYLVKE